MRPRDWRRSEEGETRSWRTRPVGRRRRFQWWFWRSKVESRRLEGRFPGGHVFSSQTPKTPDLDLCNPLDRTKRDPVLHGDFPTRFPAVGGCSPVVSVGSGLPSDPCVCKTWKTHQSRDPYVCGFVVCCIVNWVDNGCIKLEKYSVHETNEKEVMLSSIIKMKTLDWKKNCTMGKCEKKNEHKEQRVK
jgi:hypothetical protein